MDESENNLLTCEACNNSVKKDDDFCPYCGSLFIDEIFCDNHNAILADGVCIICSIPYCKKCGAKINNHFLCNQHSNYEIYEGMARVYGTLDITAIQYAKTCLEQDGLHPVLFSRNSTYGGSRLSYSLFEAAGDYLGNIIDEIKVMVPCQEVLKAEEILKSINIIT
ncbi:MAG: hypothetical protein WCS69_04405 [Ignavibacteriaceae bacterium]|jgi:hypothetical protein